MKKESIFLVVVTLIVGVLVGVIISKTGSKSTSAPAQGGGGGQPAAAINFQQNIKMLKDLVASDPQNRNAWVQLGHNYFDSNQPMEAIEAYNKALEINPNDPDVLTDQGVMFRSLGWFDKAVENFKKANQLNPNHAQSLFNLGVVYRHDLQDLIKARQAWETYMQRFPGTPGAQQIQQELQSMGTPGGMPPRQ